MATAESRMSSWSICETPNSGTSKRSTLRKRHKPTVKLEKISSAVSDKYKKKEEVFVEITRSQDSVLMISDEEEGTETVKTGLIIVSNTGKRRKVQECFLNDALSYRQKAAVDKIIFLFPQMSPKTVMIEILRILDAASNAQRKTTSMKNDFHRQIIIGVEVARQAVQHLATISTMPAQMPAEIMNGRCLDLERKIAGRRKQMEAIQIDRDSLREEVKYFRRELLAREIVKDDGRRKMGDVPDPDFPKLKPSSGRLGDRNVREMGIQGYPSGLSSSSERGF
ncbi:hypothetical protein G5I_11650 [Acromyrmex echinatior]|uniref:Uncharacterized protein n=1 Tax=Acromyrmex echinatior TaxID=103372 RepID=F4X061_ACREC|nr:hypothetical protein G5I_11650 [Acromyrmex echinatior]